MVAMCPSGRLISFVTSTYKAQFVFLEGEVLQCITLVSESVCLLGVLTVPVL